MSSLMAIIESRLHEIFAAYAEGLDVAPAKRFRTEGLMEAACMLEMSDQNTVMSLVQSCWREHFEQDFPDVEEGILRIPVLMKRAPVYPSTK